MDNDETPNESDSLCKLLLIGDSKAGKTYYAGMTAKAGFNVLYLDGDVGRPTLKTLPKDVRSRIYAIDCADTLNGGVKDHRFLDVMLEFIQQSTFRWNDSKHRVFSRKDEPGSELWEIKPAKMDHTCVFVLDSWTGLSESMMTAAAEANGVDLLTATTPEMRPVYQSAGIKSMQILQAIRSLRCHVIVLSHPDEFAHTIKPSGKAIKDIKETELIVDWTKMIPKSTSKPNSLQMGKYFTDIGWSMFSASGSERLIDFRPSDSKLSGGHLTGRESAEKYSFDYLVKTLGGSLPGSAGAPIDHWLNISQYFPEQSAGNAPTPILDGTKTQAVKSKGLHSFIK
jgi:hypothetical protein